MSSVSIALPAGIRALRFISFSLPAKIQTTRIAILTRLEKFAESVDKSTRNEAASERAGEKKDGSRRRRRRRRRPSLWPLPKRAVCVTLRREPDQNSSH